ncbi:MAG: zinc ribbon domain-containing protein [Bacillota bacterium]|nr:zinc ribbon domain-containing protein [Bacillota bacterium]
MKKFDDYVAKLNFKKVALTYIIAAVVLGLLSIAFLGFAFKDRLTFEHDFNKISEKVDTVQNINYLEQDIKTAASRSNDIVDILILNSDNKIVYSAKNSDLSKIDPFVLRKDNADGNHNYFTLNKNSNVYFQLDRNDRLYSVRNTISREKRFKNVYRGKFYESNINTKKIYDLSYAISRSGGNKVYFIRNIKPVSHGEFYLKAVAALATLLFMIYWVLVALWVYADAEKSKLSKVTWGIICLFTNLAGLLVYIIYKQNNKTCYKCKTVQDKNNTFCVNCGERIDNTCQSCGKPVRANDIFCSNCGAKLNKE